jgi:hypothetical protein
MMQPLWSVPATLSRAGDGVTLMEVLSPEERKLHKQLWPLFVAAQAAGTPAQFRRGRRLCVLLTLRLLYVLANVIYQHRIIRSIVVCTESLHVESISSTHCSSVAVSSIWRPASVRRCCLPAVDPSTAAYYSTKRCHYEPFVYLHRIDTFDKQPLHKYHFGNTSHILKSSNIPNSFYLLNNN